MMIQRRKQRFVPTSPLREVQQNRRIRNIRGRTLKRSNLLSNDLMLYAPTKKGLIKHSRAKESINLKKEIADRSYKQHLFYTYKSMEKIRTLDPISPSVLESKTVILQKNSRFKKTVVFDLDETLVHATSSGPSDFEFSVVQDDGTIARIFVNARPFAADCLKEISQVYEVIVFTSSSKEYADPVINWLDPHGTFVQHRLYRDNCIFQQGAYIKDLRILAGRNLNDIVIVDNIAVSYAYQIDNGVPIISWYNDLQDTELNFLVSYLKKISTVEDVRNANRHAFNLKCFFQNFESTLK